MAGLYRDPLDSPRVHDGGGFVLIGLGKLRDLGPEFREVLETGHADVGMELGLGLREKGGWLDWDSVLDWGSVLDCVVSSLDESVFLELVDLGSSLK